MSHKSTTNRLATAREWGILFPSRNRTLIGSDRHGLEIRELRRPKTD